MAYNGWANRETWLIALYYGDSFADIARDAVRNGETDPNDLADAFYEAFYNHETFPTNTVISDLLQPALDAIDWLDLAEPYWADAVNEVEG